LSERMVPISFKLDRDFVRRVDQVASRAGYRSRSQLVRDAIEVYIAVLEAAGQAPGGHPRERALRALGGGPEPQHIGGSYTPCEPR